MTFSVRDSTSPCRHHVFNQKLDRRCSAQLQRLKRFVELHRLVMGKAGSKQGWKGLDTDDHDREQPPTESLIDDPRSPSQEVDRTPLKVDTLKDEQHQESDDPRSPSFDVPRTPLHKLNLSGEDPREPTTGIDRTPLNKENLTLTQPDILGAIEEEGEHHGNEDCETSGSHPVEGDDAKGSDDVILKETNDGRQRNPRSKSLGQLTSRSTPSYSPLQSDENDVGEGVVMGGKRRSLPSLTKGYNKLSVEEDIHEVNEEGRVPLSEKSENQKETDEKEEAEKAEPENNEKEPDGAQTESSKLITIQ